MFGISYGELFLLLGATAALIGPKDLPIIARTAGRLAGRAIGYVQLARGQFESVMQQSQARQVHKELQDTMAQLEAIRHEIRSISVLNPGPVTRRIVDNLANTSITDASGTPESNDAQNIAETTISKVSTECTSPKASDSCNMHSQATTYERLARSSLMDASMLHDTDAAKLNNDVGPLSVLPVSAESAGMLPNRQEDVKGSEIMLEAIMEAEVACKAKDFFSRPENQITSEH